MGAYDDLNRAALLAIGLTPQWESQADVDTSRYPVAGSGVYLENSPRALVSATGRLLASVRSCDVSVQTFDAGATYTVTINGTGINVVAPSGVDALLTTMRDNIKLDATVGQAAAIPLVDAVAVDANDEDVTVSAQPAVQLLVVGDVQTAPPNTYTIDISATGAGVLNCLADPESFSIKLWGLWGGTIKTSTASLESTDWRALAGDGGEYDLGEDGFMERFDVAGLDRLYVQVTNIQGAGGDGVGVVQRAPRIHIGPAVIS